MGMFGRRRKNDEDEEDEEEGADGGVAVWLAKWRGCGRMRIMCAMMEREPYCVESVSRI